MPSPEIGIPAGASLLGGLFSSQGQQSAAGTQAAAAGASADIQKQIADQQIALQREQFNKQIELQQPFQQAGTNALAQMQGGAFAQPAAFTYDPSKYTQSAANAFLTEAGNKNVRAQLAAQGKMFSGGALKAISDYNRNAASLGEKEAYQRALDEYNAKVAQSATGYNRLASMAGIGQTATGQLGTAGQNMTSGISGALGSYGTGASNAAMNAGQATAAGQLGVGNTFNNALGTMASGYQNQSNFDRWLAQQQNNYRGGMGGAALSSRPVWSQDMYGYTGDQ